MADVTQSTKKTSKKETTSGTTTTTSGNTSVKPTQEKQTATASASSKSAKDKSVSDADLQSKILEALSDIKQQQLATDVKFTELVTRVSALEEMPVDYGYEEYMEEGELAEGEFDEASQTVNASFSHKRDLESSRFSQMTKRLKGQVILGPAIQETLASNINDVFINGLKEDEYSNMIKDEALPRPENCEALQTVKCNKIVWDFLQTNTKFLDKKLQNSETSIIKAAILVAQAVDSMAKAELQIKELGIDISKPLDNCQDALSLLGHANKQINMTRREALRPEMKRPYSSLCSSTQPYNEWLFGDIEKSAREIEDTQKIGNKLQYDSRPARGQPMFRGRPFRGRPFRGRSSSGYRYPSSASSAFGKTGSQIQDPKNWRRRGQGPPQLPVMKQ